MKKTGLMKAAALMMAAMLLGGCTPAAPETTTAETETTTVEAETTETETSEETTTVEASNNDQEEVSILVAAAASLRYAYDEQLIGMFEEQHPGIKVEGTYDSSGNLQKQIQAGLEADVFMSAAVKQMNELKDESLIDESSIVDLLENKIVLIVPAGAESSITGFENILDAEIIAVGDPEVVPAGQYAQTVFTNMGIWEDVEAKSSKGTDVTQVLNWVAEGSAEAGVVYATDAATTENVTVVAEAPEGTLDQKVIYPVGLVAASEKQEAAKLFVEFLQTPEAIAVFESYGFAAAQ